MTAFLFNIHNHPPFNFYMHHPPLVYIQPVINNAILQLILLLKFNLI